MGLSKPLPAKVTAFVAFVGEHAPRLLLSGQAWSRQQTTESSFFFGFFAAK